MFISVMVDIMMKKEGDSHLLLKQYHPVRLPYYMRQAFKSLVKLINEIHFS